MPGSGNSALLEKDLTGDMKQVNSAEMHWWHPTAWFTGYFSDPIPGRVIRISMFRIKEPGHRRISRA